MAFVEFIYGSCIYSLIREPNYVINVCVCRSVTWFDGCMKVIKLICSSRKISVDVLS